MNGSHDRRLSRLEDRLAPRTAPAQIVILEETEFEPVIWAELMAADAAGDQLRFADLAERATGVRPVFGGNRTVAVIVDYLPPAEQGGTAA